MDQTTINDNMLELIERSWSYNREKLSTQDYQHLLNRRLYNELHQTSVISQLRSVLPDFNGIFLDYGCGEGGLTVALRRLGVVAFGVDIRDRSLAIARLRAARYQMSSLFFKYDGHHLPFDKDTFDYIVSSHVLEHVQDQRMYLKEGYRILKPNGFLFIGCPNAYYPIEVHVNLWFFQWFPFVLQDILLKMMRPMHYQSMLDYGSIEFAIRMTPNQALSIVKEVFPYTNFVTDKLWRQKIKGELGHTGMNIVRSVSPFLNNRLGTYLYRLLGKQIAIIASKNAFEESYKKTNSHFY